ncbi:MAG: 2-hydroxymuconate tautomerase family protein [Leptothrix sp. (in: b-proteobacteria)]
MDFPIRIDRAALMRGHAGVLGSFLLFAKRAGAQHGISACDRLVELGRGGIVGGQIYMLAGRTPEQKKAVIEKVTPALNKATDAKKESIRIWIHEMPKENRGIAGLSAQDLGP